MSDKRETRHVPLDWEAATGLAYRMLTAGFHPNPIRIRHGKVSSNSYWAEPIQNAALRAVARSRTGVEALPATTEELAASLARYAKFIDDNRRGWKRRQFRLMTENAERISDEFHARGTLDLLDTIISRDLFKKFIDRLFNTLDLDGRKLLEAWLGEGIEFSDTKAFMDRLEIADAQTVHNIKRRIRYKGQAILTELTGNCDFGDGQ